MALLDIHLLRAGSPVCGERSAFGSGKAHEVNCETCLELLHLEARAESTGWSALRDEPTTGWRRLPEPPRPAPPDGPRHRWSRGA